MPLLYLKETSQIRDKLNIYKLYIHTYIYISKGNTEYQEENQE